HSALVLPRVQRPFDWLLFTLFAIGTGYFTMKIAAARATMSVTDTFFITSALLFGPAPATLAVAIESFVVSLRRKNSWTRVAFNTAQCSLSMWVAARAFFALARIAPLSEAFVPVGVLFLPLIALT